MLIINNRFLSLYDYNFLLVKEKIFSVNQRKAKEKNNPKIQDAENFNEEVKSLISAWRSSLRNLKVNNQPGMRFQDYISYQQWNRYQAIVDLSSIN